MKTNGNLTAKAASKRDRAMRAFSAKKYGDLLAETVPGVIADDKEYDRLEEIFNGLIDKGEDMLSQEEGKLFELLANLLEEYETRTLPTLPAVSPAEALRFLIAENNLKQADLEDIFGSQSAVSRAMNGSRRIGVEHAKGLARKFNVSAELFI